MCLLLHELKERVVHERHRAEGEARAVRVRRHARARVDDLDADAGQILEDDPPRVAEVARKAAEIVDDHRSKRTPARVREQSLQAGAIGVRTGDRGVGVLSGDTISVRRCKRAAPSGLILYRPRILTVCRIPRVDRNGQVGVGFHDCIERPRVRFGSPESTLFRLVVGDLFEPSLQVEVREKDR